VPDSRLGKVLQTGWQALLVAGSQIALTTAADSQGVSTGSASADKIMNMVQNSLPLALALGVAAAVLEEFFFRALPGWTSRHFGGQSWAKGARFWILGAVTSTAFALSHNIGAASVTEVIPVPQLALGLFFWNVYGNYGYKGAMLTHAGINAAIMSAYKVGSILG
jgi:membrane protease YdiL (CAAX protease family)